MAKRKGGWYNERGRHSLAARGVKTPKLMQRDYMTEDPFPLDPLYEEDYTELYDKEFLYRGEIVKFKGVQHDPRTSEVVNLVFESEDGEELALRSWSEVEELK